LPDAQYNIVAASEKNFSECEQKNRQQRAWIQLIVFAAAVLGHLPSLGAFWNQDDWGLLARAAGQLSAPDHGARWLSQQAYWQLMYPLFGLATAPYVWTRLLLHGASSVLVTRLAFRGGARPLTALVAGLLLAATPLVFTPLYWAAGIQELLAACCALLAVERWLAGGRTNLLLVAGAGILSMLAKECALGLPLLLAVLPRRRPGEGANRLWMPRLVVALLALVSLLECVLVWRHFDTAGGQAYALGDWFTPLRNLTTYGWWLAIPWPIHSSHLRLAMALAGGGVWLLWGLYAVRSWRRDSRLPAACLLAALLALAPALPLATHVYPYLAYPAAAAGALVVAWLLARRLVWRPLLVMAAVAAAIAWSYWGMEYRLGRRTAAGSPADPVVLRTALSYAACRFLEELPLPDAAAGREIVLLQPPASGQATELAEQLGEGWVTGSPLYHALGGTRGPSLVLGPQTRVSWTNGLRNTPATAFVLASTGHALRPWGPTPQALQYLVLHDVAASRYERARLHLLRAGLLSGDTVSFFHDPALLFVAPADVLAKKDVFLDYLADGRRDGRSEYQIDGQRENFLNLLSICTGIDREQLESGGRAIETDTTNRKHEAGDTSGTGKTTETTATSRK